MTQEQRLKVAKRTEMENALSLQQLLSLEEKQKEVVKPKNIYDAFATQDIKMIRIILRRDENQIVFFNTNPSIQNSIPEYLQTAITSKDSIDKS